MNASESSRRRLAAVWFADIVGYTELASRDEVLALMLVERLHSLSADVTSQNDGRLVKKLGDGVLVEFSSTESAVRAALQLNELFDRGQRIDDAPRLRIGIHIGDVVATPDGDVYGDGVNLASRLQQLANPGEVLVSEDVMRQLRQRPEYLFRSRGRPKIRGHPGQLRAFQVERGPTGKGGELEPVSTQVDRLRRSGRRWWQTTLALAGFLFLLAGIAWLVRDRTRGQVALTSAIAVLPFSVHGSAEYLHLGRGMVGLLSDRIASMSDFPTVDSPAVLRQVPEVSGARVGPEEARAIASRLGVRWVVVGSILEASGRIRLDAFVYDVSGDDVEVGRGGAEGPVEDLFWIADHVADQLLRSLGHGFTFTPYTTKPRCVTSCTSEDVLRHISSSFKETEASCEVVIGIRIDQKGTATATSIVRSSGNPECDHGALEWAKTTRWTPAYNAEEPVVTWIAQPITIGG